MCCYQYHLLSRHSLSLVPLDIVTNRTIYESPFLDLQLTIHNTNYFIYIIAIYLNQPILQIRKHHYLTEMKSHDSGGTVKKKN